MWFTYRVKCREVPDWEKLFSSEAASTHSLAKTEPKRKGCRGYQPRAVAKFSAVFPAGNVSLLIAWVSSTRDDRPVIQKENKEQHARLRNEKAPRGDMSCRPVRFKGLYVRLDLITNQVCVLHTILLCAPVIWWRPWRTSLVPNSICTLYVSEELQKSSISYSQA